MFKNQVASSNYSPKARVYNQLPADSIHELCMLKTAHTKKFVGGRKEGGSPLSLSSQLATGGVTGGGTVD